MKKKIVFILLIIVSMCGLSSCKKHICNFDQQVVEEQYLCKEASCDTIALYYYSCTCGEKGQLVFSHGSFKDHKFDEGEIMGDPILIEGTDMAEYQIVYTCSVCEEKKIVKETMKAPEKPTLDDNPAQGDNQQNPNIDILKNVIFEDVEEVYVEGKTYSIVATNIPEGYRVEYIGNNVTGSGNHLVEAKFYDSTNNFVGSLFAYIKVAYQVEFPEI